MAPIILKNCIEPALCALLLALVYLKDTVSTLHDPGELGFINNRTLESCLTLRQAAAFHAFPETDYGFTTRKKRERENQETDERRAATVSGYADTLIPSSSWLC